MTNPQSREAFAKVENDWYEKHPPCERGVFDAGGKISWTACEEPEPMPEPHLHVGRQYTPPDNLEGWFDENGKAQWGPRDATAPTDPDPRRVKYLEKFLELDVESLAGFMKRAGHNVPEWDLKASQEYAAYYLYARGRCTPFSKAEFRALKSEISSRLRTKKRVQRFRQKAGDGE